jgi:outer membrane protein assembly factor BamA
MKKLLFTAIAVLGFTFANAQSNKQGSMHVNVMGGFLAGSATDKGDWAGAEKIKYTANGAGFGVNFQYGLAESFSAGIGVEYGTAVLSYKSGSSDYDSSYADPSRTLLKVNLSGRYYFLNKDNFNVYAGPSVGFTSGKDKTVLGVDFGGEKTKYSGLNYGINAGGNYYFTDIVGVIVNLGYEGSSLKSKQTESGVEYTGKSSLGGVKVMAGLALKF